MQECHSCGFKITGYGCTKNNIRVTDHNTCGDWEATKPAVTKHDNDARVQYFKAGYILDLGV